MSKLHVAIIQAVELMNGVYLGEGKQGEALREAHDILRKALTDAADNPEAASHNMAAELIVSGAPNYYVERLVCNQSDREIEVIARYIDGETPVEQLAVARPKLENYEKTLARIAEGEAAPMLLARAVLSGANWDVR